MSSDQSFLSRGMAGAGILALAHSGRHDSPEVTVAADWMLDHGFKKYNQTFRTLKPGYTNDRFHYGVFYCTQAAYQLGGKHWEQFYPSVAKLLIENQSNDGGWAAEDHPHETRYGRSYTTSLVLLALGAPNQLLPIFQR